MPNIEDITLQKSNAERKSYVVVGAILSCSNGSKLSRLKMPFSHGVFVKGKPQMNIMDFIPNVNIMPFGKCSSLKNPAVASATAANNGVLTPMPCTPLTTMPWIDGKADKVVGDHPALLNKSTNMCFHCGLIKIEDDGQNLGGVTIGVQSLAQSGPSESGFGQGSACKKPQEKPTMWDNFVKGISKLGDVPAAMQKAASELPGALEKAANDLPKGLQKAAEDLPKGVNLFVQEGFVEPIQEDLDTLQDEDINLEDALAISGLAMQALTLGRSKSIKDLVSALRKGKKATGKPPVPTKTGGGSDPNNFVNEHAKKHMYDPSKPSTKNRSQYGQDVDVKELRRETMTNPDKAYTNWPNPNNPNPNKITKYYKEFDGNISTPDTPTGSHRVFENLDNPKNSSHFPHVPRNKE
jgi:Domain of unknown function (DUF4280)